MMTITTGTGSRGRRRGARGRRARRGQGAGFTIVEVLIVIIIIIILAGLLLPAVLQALVLAKVTATRMDIQHIGTALDLYHADFGTYPPSCVWWDATDWYTAYSANRDTMDGAECLVYFLGGGPAFQGFAVGSKVYGPYLEFQRDSLINVDNDRFREMQDALKQGVPYLYFRADRSNPGNEYNPRDNAHILDAGGINPDGSLIPPRPGEPVRDSSGYFYRPTSYQIISAGRDGRFARQSDVEPSSDDITNFMSTSRR